MEIKAQLNNLRMAPRKVRLVTGTLTGMDALRAKGQLEYLVKRSARPLVKLLDSALANAQNNFGLAKENLYIKRVLVNEGTKLKRFRPKGFGSASPIEKKTSHITVVLDERVPGMKASPKQKSTVVTPPSEAKNISEPTTTPSQETKGKTDKKGNYQPEKEVKKPGVLGGLKRKFFRRKTI